MNDHRNLFALVFLFLYIIFSTSFLFKVSSHKTENEVCISVEEQKLYNTINEYRRQHKLAAIPLSKSLTYVAQQHVHDLAANHPDKLPCNSHSWSNKGSWKGCCYTEDHANASCMWKKPAELTSYKSNGYEIACKGTFGAEEILKSWKESRGHNSVILNQATWKKIKWNAVGVGIYEEHAVVWFGEMEDTEMKPALCKAFPPTIK
jgi:uncharacterized protein YkwD